MFAYFYGTYRKAETATKTSNWVSEMQEKARNKREIKKLNMN